MIFKNFLFFWSFENVLTLKHYVTPKNVKEEDRVVSQKHTSVRWERKLEKKIKCIQSQ